MTKIISFNEPIIPAFSYFYTLFNKLKNRQDPIIDNYYLFGGRSAGKSVSIHIFIGLCLFADIDITIYMFRHLKGTVFKSVWIDVFEYVKDYEGVLFTINRTQKEIRRIGGRARFFADGLHTQQSDDTPYKANLQLDTYYSMTIFEEADQIRDKDRQGVRFAVRGKRLKHKINVELFNPTNSTIPVVHKIATAFPFNEHLAKTVGSYHQLQRETITFNNKTTSETSLYHRSNWRCNPFVANDPKEQIKFRDYWRQSPFMAKCWDYGAMGGVDDAIFSTTIKFLGYQDLSPELVRFDTMFAGIDFGFKKDAFACVLMGKMRDCDKIYVVGEFYWENKYAGLSHDEINERVILWLMDLTSHFRYHNDIVITCDNADYSWIEMLNTKANRFSDKMWFRGCYKPKVREGIDIIVKMMSLGAFIFNIGKLPHLKNELMTLAWKPNVQELKLKDIDNHSFDAFRYGVYQHMEFLSTYNQDEINFYNQQQEHFYERDW